MGGGSLGESSNFRYKFAHQVFLSFRGEDVRNGFAGHLFTGLRLHGFRVFMDNDGLEHGKNIQLKLLEAIGGSQVFIVILSPRYAESRWCLDELAKIMELNASPDHFVLPVFFSVDPHDVRHQTGLNDKFFEAHEKRFGSEIGKVEKWRWALREVADLKGQGLTLEAANGPGEAQLIKSIIKGVRKILSPQNFTLPPNIIGVDPIVQDISAWIRDGSQDVGVGVIHGMGGIGKTTIAQIVFNANCNYLDKSSFLADISTVSEEDNLMVHLQRKLILDITGKDARGIYTVAKGMTRIRDAVGSRRILLVLDEVEEMKHLSGLFDHPEWFCPGSKIIITTSNPELRMMIPKFQQEFVVSPLNEVESTKLLSLLVFDQDVPKNGYEEPLGRFVTICEGVPSILTSLATSLRGEEDVEIWETLFWELEELRTLHDDL